MLSKFHPAASENLLPQRKSTYFIFSQDMTDFGTMTVVPWQPQTS